MCLLLAVAKLLKYFLHVWANTKISRIGKSLSAWAKVKRITRRIIYHDLHGINKILEVLVMLVIIITHLPMYEKQNLSECAGNWFTQWAYHFHPPNLASIYYTKKFQALIFGVILPMSKQKSFNEWLKRMQRYIFPILLRLVLFKCFL